MAAQDVRLHAPRDAPDPDGPVRRARHEDVPVPGERPDAALVALELVLERAVVDRVDDDRRLRKADVPTGVSSSAGRAQKEPGRRAGEDKGLTSSDAVMMRSSSATRQVTTCELCAAVEEQDMQRPSAAARGEGRQARARWDELSISSSRTAGAGASGLRLAMLVGRAGRAAGEGVDKGRVAGRRLVEQVAVSVGISSRAEPSRGGLQDGWAAGRGRARCKPSSSWRSSPVPSLRPCRLRCWGWCVPSAGWQP